MSQGGDGENGSFKNHFPRPPWLIVFYLYFSSKEAH